MNPWRNDEPPRDGTVIVALGRVLWQAELVRVSEPFTAAVRWQAGDFPCWTYADSKMAVACTPEDVVSIDWWAPLPEGWTA